MNLHMVLRVARHGFGYLKSTAIQAAQVAQNTPQSTLDACEGIRGKIQEDEAMEIPEFNRNWATEPCSPEV